MIEIRITDDKLEVTGHAGYDIAGKDIVCAAVSILTYTFINLYDTDVWMDSPDGIMVTYRDADTDFIRTGFRMLEKEYPEYIRVYERINKGG